MVNEPAPNSSTIQQETTEFVSPNNDQRGENSVANKRPSSPKSQTMQNVETVNRINQLNASNFFGLGESNQQLLTPRPNSSFSPYNPRYPSSPPIHSKHQRRLLKLNRRKRAIEASASVIKAEQVNGFRGNDSLESLVEYIEGTTDNLSMKIQQNKDNKDSKSKKSQRKIAVSSSKKNKPKKTICQEEEPVSESVNGDCDLEVRSLPPPEVCDDSEDGDETPLPAKCCILFSPKSDEIDSSSSCSVDGDHSFQKTAESFDSTQNIDFSGEFGAETNVSSAVLQQYVCQNVAETKLLHVNMPLASSLPKHAGKNSTRNKNIAQHSAKLCDQIISVSALPVIAFNQSKNQIVHQKNLHAVSQSCRCHPGKMHVEFLDRREEKNVDEIHVLNGLSFGFDDFFPKNGNISRAADDNGECVVAKKIQTSSMFVEIALERVNARKETTICANMSNLRNDSDGNVRKVLTPIEKRNEKVIRDVRNYVNKCWEVFVRYPGDIVRHQ